MTRLDHHHTSVDSQPTVGPSSDKWLQLSSDTRIISYVEDLALVALQFALAAAADIPALSTFTIYAFPVSAYSRD